MNIDSISKDPQTIDLLPIQNDSEYKNVQITEPSHRISTQPNDLFSFRGDGNNANNLLIQNNTNNITTAVPIPIHNNNVQVLNEIIEEDDEDDDLEEVSVLFNRMLKANIMTQSFFLITMGFFIWEPPLMILIAVTCLNDIYNLIYNAYKLCKNKNMNRKNCVFKKNKVVLWDNLLILLYKVFVMVAFYKSFFFSFGNTILFFQFGGYVIYLLQQKFILKKAILSESIETLYTGFIFIQILMVSLKIDKLISLSWKDTFWCFWIFFCVMIATSLGFGLIFLGKLYQKCFESVDLFELCGLFWLFYVSAGLTINSAMTVICISEYFEEKHYSINEMKENFFIILGYTVFLFIYSILFYKRLIKFLEKIGSEDDETYDINAEEREEPKKAEAKKLRVEKNPTKFFFPAFLTKTSSTYFKAANSSFMQLAIPSSQKRRRSSIKSKNSFSFHLQPPINSVPNMKDYNQHNKNQISMDTKNIHQFVDEEESEKNKKHNISDPGIKFKTFSTSPKFKQTEEKDKSTSEIEANNTTVTNCLICFENVPDAVFMDCGHGGLCYHCATEIFKKTEECYLCRKTIKQVLQMDFQSKKGNFIKVKASARLVNMNEESQLTSNSKDN